MEVLAKAGFDATQVTQALPGVLALAATEEMKVEKAADIATKTLKAFGLQASEMTRVADVLAYVAATQPTAWQTLQKNHGPKAEGLLLDRLRVQLDQRGTRLELAISTRGASAWVRLAQAWLAQERT
jgi:hypothetical protein